MRDKTISQLRDEGYAVVLFNPEELRGTDVDRLEEILVERGNDCIAQMATQPDPDADPVQHVYEILCQGFDGTTDATDAHVLLVRSPGPSEIEEVIRGSHAVWSVAGKDDGSFDSGIDFTLPDQSKELAAKIKSFEDPPRA